MTRFFQLVAGLALLGIAVFFGLGVYFFFTLSEARQPIGGELELIPLLACGAVILVLYAMGLAVASALRAQGKHGFRRSYNWALALLGTLTPASLGVKHALGLYKDLQSERNIEARQQQFEAETALVADPLRLQAYVAEHGVETRLPSSERSPLEAATSQNYSELIDALLTKGARVTDQTLVLAVEKVDATTFERILAHTRFIDRQTVLAYASRRDPVAASIVSASNAPPIGLNALDVAYTIGRLDALTALTRAGVLTNSATVRAMASDAMMKFFPDEVKWKDLLIRWQDPSCPATIQQRLTDEERTTSKPRTAFGEEEVLNTLNSLTLHDSLQPDPAIGLERLEIPAWMKVSHPADSNDNLTRDQVNRAILEALYPGLLPRPFKGKGFVGLQLLARGALEKEGDEGRLILRWALEKRNIEVLDMLQKEGFHLDLLQSELTPLDQHQDQPMKVYLESHGLRLPAPKH